jgi:predicted metalloprotease with PDZ domain
MPDLLFFIPSRVEQVLEKGWSGFSIGNQPGIWRADGPPMPPELIEAYFRYYVKTHSLVLLSLGCVLLWIAGRKKWLWLAVPYALHIVMDMPTHERYLTQPLWPVSTWHMQGLSWGDPRIFFPHLAVLIGTFAWLKRSSRILVLLLLVPSSADAQEIEYRVTFPAPEHRWMQVEVTIPDAPEPLELRMSRASPGRYALHEFAKNVYDVTASGASGAALAISRPNPYQWNVEDHDGTVRVRYRVFGNRLDGTYLAIDTTHAHMNMPAAFMWARGTAGRPVRIAFTPPSGARWRAATQLFPTDDPWTFTAPNLQYFMDSPTELGAFWEHRFTLPEPGSSGSSTFRIALHHDDSDDAARLYAEGVARIAAEQGAVFGEFPSFEPGYYTFLADYLPHADGDGMEHRNSTVLTGQGPLSEDGHRRAALGTVSHELFHAWNVERIRPASLEPFDFERVNMSGELWLAEGFTSYYGPLVMHRAGIASLSETLAIFGASVDAVVNGAGRGFRSVVEMSRLAAFVDQARAVDETNLEIAFISYYTWGAAIGLALDLSLRELSGGRVTLDDYMRALWRTHGRAGGAFPGFVANPYTLADARDRLAEVSGSREFAQTFFSRYIDGREAADYARLLERAGLRLRLRRPGEAWIGRLSFQPHAQGLLVTGLVAPSWPAYSTGLEKDDVLLSINDRPVATLEDVRETLRSRQPGDRVELRYIRRGGQVVTSSLTLQEDPELELVAVEETGGTLTSEQKAFRDTWLASRIRK